MAPSGEKVTLDNRVMGKMGKSYSRAEIIIILRHYGAHFNAGSTKLVLFQLLHEFAARENLATLPQRRQLLREPVPSTGSSPEEAASPTADSLITRCGSAGVRTEKKKLCSICAEEIYTDEFPLYKTTIGCTHEIEVCTACLQKSVELQMDDKAWNTLECPMCDQKLSYEEVKAHSSAEFFHKYDRQVTMHANKDVANYCMCLGPGCGSGQVHSSGHDQPIMTCNSCGFKTCYSHQMPWHYDMNCQEYNAANTPRQAQNEASVVLIQKIGKICPNCSVPGIQVSGCDHMTCPRCSHEYCAVCLAAYSDIRTFGAVRHTRDCKYNSPQFRHPSRFFIYPTRAPIARMN